MSSSAQETIERVGRLAASFAQGAGERDALRRLPAQELRQLSEAGLFGLTVPARFGGQDVSVRTLTEVFRLLGAADPNIAQIPQSHFVFLEALRDQGDEAQQKYFFGEALAGARFANAQSERTSRTVAEDRTALLPDGQGRFLLVGEKFYATGSLLADWLVVRAILPDAPKLENGQAPKVVVFVRTDAPGVTVEDDWNGFGQRTTASGTVRLDRVPVRADAVVPYTPIFGKPTTYGAFAQVLHAALDVGIARAAVSAAAEQVGRARPWFESGVGTAAEDPLLLQQAGEVEVAVRAAEALLKEAAGAIDEARADLSAESAARASVATAVAKVAGARAAVDASSALFELAGTRSAAEPLNLSRFWRDARTHTLHDPVRWKVQHIGRWVIAGTPPPRHGTV